MLLGRPLETLLPSHIDPGPPLQREWQEERRDEMKRHHDQTNGKDLPPLYVRQKVRVQNVVTSNSEWQVCRIEELHCVYTQRQTPAAKSWTAWRAGTSTDPSITRLADRTGYDPPSECRSVPSEARASDIAPDPGSCAVSPTRRSMPKRQAPEYLRNYKL